MGFVGSRMAYIIRKAYGKRLDLRPLEVYPPRRYALSRLDPVIARLREKGVLISLLITATAITVITIYYYNLLTRTTQDVLASQSRVETLMQRRSDLSVNLAKTVLDYAEHERNIFNHVAELRALAMKLNPDMNTKGLSVEKEGFPKALGGITLEDSLSRLMAVAEQYPALKLSENFRNFMDALIEVERELAAKRMEFSDQVNRYTTIRMTFPGNIFGLIFRFKPIHYFEAEPHAKKFTPVRY